MTSSQFYNGQLELGSAIRRSLGFGDYEPGDNHAPPEKNTITNMRKDTSSTSVPWLSYDDFAGHDVIIGEVPLHLDQQKDMILAKKYDIDPIPNPFTQVVLVTPTGK